MSPLPFPEIGKRAKDLLTKDYNCDKKFSLSLPVSNGLGLSATGLQRDQLFFGDITSQLVQGNTMVDVKVDTYSNITTKVTMKEALAGVTAAVSFNLPDHKSGKLDLKYLHPHASVNSSIGLTPSPLFEFNASMGTKDLVLGGDVGFDTASASFTKYNAGISLNKPDFSIALILADKGEAVKASYYHTVNPSNAVAAEMIHRLSNYENSFTIGSAHVVDPLTFLKTRLSHNGKVAMLCQREWRPKSLVTVSAELDTKETKTASKFGLAIALRP
ncbi:Mitochondrial outer membrane protein porin 6-like protein [Drosera capensis]